MSRLQHILFPFDFSRQGCEVVPYVRALAHIFDARVTVIGVVPPTFDSVPDAMGGPGLRAGEDPSAWRRNLQNRLDHAFSKELSDLQVQRVADCGDPAIRITEYAHEHAVDLIMMPTHGVGTFRSFLVGSVTSKVLHDAGCAVWTAAHAETQTAAESPKSVLCAIDGSPATPAVAQWAVDFARAGGSRLRLLHVVGPISDWPSLETERRLQEHVREDARKKLTATLTAARIEAPLTVSVGGIVETVVEEARQEQADLIIIGRGQVNEPFGRLRTHAFGIIQRSHCPVLSV